MPVGLHDRSGVLSGDRLRLLLTLHLGPGRAGELRTTETASDLGVSPSTIRRWIRHGLPESRLAEIDAQLMPPAATLEQEAKDLARARGVVQSLHDVDERTVPVWAAADWLRPHRLILLKVPKWGIVVPRVGMLPATALSRKEQLRGIDKNTRYADVVRSEFWFPTKYHAVVARLELLSTMRAWRVHVAPSILSRGATQAWLLEAPQPKRAWMRQYRVDKARSTIRDLIEGDEALTREQNAHLRAIRKAAFAHRARRQSSKR